MNHNVRRSGALMGNRLLSAENSACTVVPGIFTSVARRPGGSAYPVIVCFCPDRKRLMSRWPALHQRTTSAGALWIAWPKRSSGMATDLDEQFVREFALANGRVDVKVCAIDEVWSGLKNVIRKADR